MYFAYEFISIYFVFFIPRFQCIIFLEDQQSFYSRASLTFEEKIFLVINILLHKLHIILIAYDI